jgi:hypothetical protein
MRLKFQTKNHRKAFLRNHGKLIRDWLVDTGTMVIFIEYENIYWK